MMTNSVPDSVADVKKGTDEKELIHFIGIGGAGMGTLAQMYLEKGFLVQGSDQTDENNNVSRLQSLGVKTFIGHNAKNIQGANCVVITSAIKDSNSELQAAKKLGIPVLHRSEALANLVNSTYLFAIAGSHGKTTTAAMLSHTLQELGIDCSYSFGAQILNDPRSATGGYIGKDNVSVIEADESDKSFLNFTPTVSVILNIEPDHLDFYKSEKNFFASFCQFAKSAKDAVIYCADDIEAKKFLEELDLKNLISYGYSDDADFHVSEFDMKLFGKHNFQNAAAVILAVKRLLPEISVEEIEKAIGTFPGTARRFEFKGSKGSVRLFDDYAHLPTEIKATILSAKPLLEKNGKIKVLFQSHLFSRTKNFAKGFAEALQFADEVIVTDVYPAREEIDPSVTPDTILQYITRDIPHYGVRDRIEAAKLLGQIADENDILITIGAGDLNILDNVIFENIELKNIGRD
ncbi:MAG: UDP-N-acetylmuramate--L-alanine ligase [Bifidobacteriaceae bacterium]|nr:UDP-N-acetylmuramate--L-alanine ligase [Bifidobacteriaceae bacterium]